MQAEVLMTGIGGQGIQLSAKTLALAATDEGHKAMLSAHYGGEMRGGQTEASVVIARGPLRALPILPSAWSAFVMHLEFWEPVRVRLRPGGVVAVNSDLLDGDLAVEDVRIFPVPAMTIANDLGAPMSAAFVLLGAYVSITGIVGLDSAVNAMKRLVPAYRTKHVAANEAAIRAGGKTGPELAAPAWDQAGAA